jgi:hypothetical protein
MRDNNMALLFTDPLYYVRCLHQLHGEERFLRS